jgi:hypothetical protein
MWPIIEIIGQGLVVPNSQLLLVATACLIGAFLVCRQPE